MPSLKLFKKLNRRTIGFNFNIFIKTPRNLDFLVYAQICLVIDSAGIVGKF